MAKKCVVCKKETEVRCPSCQDAVCYGDCALIHYDNAHIPNGDN